MEGEDSIQDCIYEFIFSLRRFWTFAAIPNNPVPSRSMVLGSGHLFRLSDEFAVSPSGSLKLATETKVPCEGPEVYPTGTKLP